VNQKAYTVNQFMDTHKLGRTRTYEEIDSGRLVTYKVGRRRFISDRAAEDWQRRGEVECKRLLGQM
jgi:hypothetical protein